MNKSYTVKEEGHELNGQTLYTGRYATVNLFFYCICNDEYYLLATKRGEGAADKKNMWCVPCGYLEDDESGEAGALRELYEETKIDIRDAVSNVFFANVLTDPKYCNHGNVELNYYCVIKADELPNVSDKMDGQEVSATEWVHISKLHDNKVWCFYHDLTASYIYKTKLKDSLK